MKIKFMTALVCVMLALLLCTGCELGSYQDHPGAVGTGSNTDSADNTAETKDSQSGEFPGDDTSNPVQNDDPVDEKTPYTVSLYYKNQPFTPGDAKINAIWHGQNSDIVVELDQNGEASAGVLDGDYEVYLSGLPAEYSYNPNVYRATGTDRHVQMIITNVLEAEKGDGGIHATPSNMAIYQSGGCYVVNYQGTYRATCEKGQYIYFEYTPDMQGRYVVESLCNVYDDEINPVLEIYNGTVAFKWLTETRDTGGASLDGGFTKNFKYQIDAANVGPSYTFGISAVSKTGEYPVTVDFSITYIGPYDSGADVVKVITAEDADGIPNAKDTNETFNYADVGTKHFDGSMYRYDGDTGLYRVYDEDRYAENGGWGPYLCVMIDKAIPCYTTTTLYSANWVGLGQNFLTLRVRDKAYDGYITYDYEKFIRESYYKKCNSDGVCYVTAEMKEFLQLYATNYTLWTDHVCATEGSPEDYGYSAAQDDLWLFACGFYENGR